MKKLEKQITIGLTEDQTCGISISPDITSAEAFQLVGTLALHVLRAYYQVAETTLITNLNSGATPKAKKLKNKTELAAATIGIKESMYDAMDSVFSNVLNQFYPEAPQYTLEDEAILELTNKKIEERYNALSEEDKVKYSDAYNKTLNALKIRAHEAELAKASSNQAQTQGAEVSNETTEATDSK